MADQIKSDNIVWVRVLPPVKIRVKWEWVSEDEGEMDAQVEICLGHPIWSPYWAEGAQVTRLSIGAGPAVMRLMDDVPQLARLHELLSVDPCLSPYEWRWLPEGGWQFMQRAATQIRINGMGKPAATNMWCLQEGQTVTLTEVSTAVWHAAAICQTVGGQPWVSISPIVKRKPIYPRVDVLRRMRTSRPIVMVGEVDAPK